MKISELIEELSKYDGESPVKFYATANFNALYYQDSDYAIMQSIDQSILSREVTIYLEV